jgi:hypothetical protein
MAWQIEGAKFAATLVVAAMRTPTNVNAYYGASLSFDYVSFADLTRVWLSRLKQGLHRRIFGS